jgi:hypothetical protein
MLFRTRSGKRRKDNRVWKDGDVRFKDYFLWMPVYDKTAQAWRWLE